jgi:hypothetical protein
MTYVIAHATRQLDRDDPRRKRGDTAEFLTELPDPNVKGSGGVSYLTGRRIELPGFSGGWVWASFHEAARYPTMADARKTLRQLGRRTLLVLDVDTAAEYERRRHLARVRAKAKKI